jgi:hypothetical protein
MRVDVRPGPQGTSANVATAKPAHPSKKGLLVRRVVGVVSDHPISPRAANTVAPTSRTSPDASRGKTVNDERQMAYRE